MTGDLTPSVFRLGTTSKFRAIRSKSTRSENTRCATSMAIALMTYFLPPVRPGGIRARENFTGPISGRRQKNGTKLKLVTSMTIFAATSSRRGMENGCSQAEATATGKYLFDATHRSAKLNLGDSMKARKTALASGERRTHFSAQRTANG